VHGKFILSRFKQVPEVSAAIPKTIFVFFHTTTTFSTDTFHIARDDTLLVDIMPITGL
jgi:hypothetical protein